MLISDDPLTFLWLATNDAELTTSVEPFLVVKNFLKNRFGINGDDVIQILSHLNYVFGFCIIFGSFHSNKLKQTDLINNLRF